MHLRTREETVRVLIETLRLTRDNNRIQMEDIASNARSTESFTKVVLTNALVSSDNGRISLSPRLRIRLALDVARIGRLGESARTLTWQEFENFAGECLEEAGFQTEKNVRVRGDSRAWQIDVVGSRGDLVLSVDCKHWNTPAYPSRFKLAAKHQKAATLHFLNESKKTALSGKDQQALPVILTLSEPPGQFSEGVALVSVEKFPSFLSGVTPYDENLPFIISYASVVENPMRQSKGSIKNMNIVVIGAGTMGSGIAYSSAASGHSVTIVEQDQKLLDQGIHRVDEYVQRNLSRGHISKEQASQIHTKVRGSLDFAKACHNADLVVEAVFEDPRIKEQVFSTLDKVCPENTILASNTSSISISKIASATKRPEKVLGLHFFNPVPTMKLVELIKGERTSPDSVKAATSFVETLGKTVVQSADKTGFIVNRALMPFINESVKLLEENVATRDDIDKAFLLGTNHPMGPLQLADFIGVDVVLSTLKVLETEFGEAFTPTPLLEQMVKDGNLGRKTKKGFYDY